MPWGVGGKELSGGRVNPNLLWWGVRLPRKGTRTGSSSAESKQTRPEIRCKVSTVASGEEETPGHRAGVISRRGYLLLYTVP